MTLGMEVGLGPGDFVFDGDQAYPQKKGTPSPIFGPCLLWPNDWMDEDATWYGSRLQPRPHCIRRGRSSLRKGHITALELKHLVTTTNWYGSVISNAYHLQAVYFNSQENINISTLETDNLRDVSDK